MELNSKVVLEILKEKGIHTFYHADTVRTSCSFLKKGRLLSRGLLESQRLPMTSQNSDEKDKKFGLWHHFFVDGVDIHDRINRRNLYGPVLFCIDVSVLEQEQISTIRVTKRNPTNWNTNTPQEERYFQNVAEFKKGYNYGDFTKMFVLPGGSDIVKLSHYLCQILIDDTERKMNSISLCDQAIKALDTMAKESGLNCIPIKKKICPPQCKCKDEYQTMRQQTILKFYNP